MGYARKIAERLSRDRILKRRLPAVVGGGVIHVSPDSSLSFWRPHISSDLFDFAIEFVKPGNTVWDIGANVGLFAFAAANRAGSGGSVVAIEADMWLVGLLRQSVALQNGNSAKVEVLPAAASDAVGIAEFNIAQRGRSANFLASSLGSTQSGGIRQSVQVMTLTLDWLLERRSKPSVVKIDVEGAECAVLRGAQRLLKDVRPVILCEVSERNAPEVSRTLLENLYTMYDWGDRARGPRDQAAWNTLAIPAESSAQK
jgi:FkbM family methyltransferase